MSFFSRLANHPQLKHLLRPLFPGLSPKSQQEQIDLYRAAALLKCFEWYKENPNNQPSQKEAESFYEAADKIGDAKSMKKAVQTSLDKQVVDIFRKVDTYKNLIEELPQHIKNKGSGPDYPSLLQILGYELQSRASTIPAAGDGVFIKGGACPGAVLGFFPGIVHLAEYTNNSSYIKDLLPDDQFMMIVRPDRHIIDARGAHKVPSNPYALGHKINHVPPGAAPNCLQIPFNFAGDPFNIEAFPHDLRKHIPNIYAKPPTILGTTDRSACMHGMVVIAAKPLEDNEELFVDYRLNTGATAGEVPTWYTPFDVEGERRRWQEDNENSNGNITNSSVKLGDDDGSNTENTPGHNSSTR